jgi:hypothetical protein
MAAVNYKIPQSKESKILCFLHVRANFLADIVERNPNDAGAQRELELVKNQIPKVWLLGYN